MTLTVRERVLTAFKEALETISVEPLYIERNRSFEVGSNRPALIMHDGDHNADFTDSVSKRHLLNVMVDGYVDATSGELAGQAANALYGEVVNAVLADESLGGVSHEIRELSTGFETIQGGGDTVLMAFQVIFEVTFFTQHSDAYALAP